MYRPFESKHYVWRPSTYINIEGSLMYIGHEGMIPIEGIAPLTIPLFDACNHDLVIISPHKECLALKFFTEDGTHYTETL